jgi:hypothetical protein
MIHWMEFGVKKQRSAQWEGDLVRLEELGSRRRAGRLDPPQIQEASQFL